MARIPLDDERWSDLPVRCEPDTPIADSLRHLVEKPDDLEVFEDLWPYLCSEDTPRQAAYAALPYLIECAERLDPRTRIEYLIFFGYLRECTEDENVPDEFKEDFSLGMQRALELFYLSLPEPVDEGTLPHLLSSFAALRGSRKIAAYLSHYADECPHCGEELSW